MTIEEKAKAYDEALKEAVIAHKDEDRHLKATLERIFPELRESEDERIRKALIDYFDDANKADENPLQSYGIHTDKAIAWLEKQKEFVSTDFDDVWKTADCDELTAPPLDKYSKDAIKEMCHAWYDKGIELERKRCLEKQGEKSTAKPKFHEGDWIVHNVANFVFQIVGVDTYGYNVVNREGYAKTISLSNEENYHLWTISDAKDGDVLAWDDNKCIVLFKNIYDEDSFNSYGFVGHCTGAFESRLSYHDIKGAHPATKEQRDLLFGKMKEEGYEWNANKKRIEEDRTDTCLE